jgi:hypothetical protein
LQFGRDQFSELDEIDRQYRKHRIEAIGRACGMPGFDLVGNLGEGRP